MPEVLQLLAVLLLANALLCLAVLIGVGSMSWVLVGLRAPLLKILALAVERGAGGVRSTKTPMGYQVEPRSGATRAEDEPRC